MHILLSWNSIHICQDYWLCWQVFGHLALRTLAETAGVLTPVRQNTCWDGKRSKRMASVLAQHPLEQHVMGMSCMVMFAAFPSAIMVAADSIIAYGKAQRQQYNPSSSPADSAGVVQAWLPYTCSRCCTSTSKCLHHNNYLQSICNRWR